MASYRQMVDLNSKSLIPPPKILKYHTLKSSPMMNLTSPFALHRVLLPGETQGKFNPLPDDISHTWRKLMPCPVLLSYKLKTPLISTVFYMTYFKSCPLCLRLLTKWTPSAVTDCLDLQKGPSNWSEKSMTQSTLLDCSKKRTTLMDSRMLGKRRKWSGEGAQDYVHTLCRAETGNGSYSITWAGSRKAA